MTIKNKLIANVLFTAFIVVALSASSFFSIQIINKALLQLTEKSIPFQIGTLELQRELHESIALLYRAATAKTMEEYRALRTEAGAALARISNTQKKLKAIGSATQQVSDELSPMAQEFLNAVEERIHCNIAAVSANEEVSEIMERSSSRLDDLDRSIHHLQTSYSNSFATALESTGNYSYRLRSIEELRNLVRELQLLTVTVQTMQQPSSLLIARAKLRAVAGRITGNSYYAVNRAIAAYINGFIEKLSGYINLRLAAIAQKMIRCNRSPWSPEKTCRTSLTIFFRHWTRKPYWPVRS